VRARREARQSMVMVDSDRRDGRRLGPARLANGRADVVDDVSHLRLSIMIRGRQTIEGRRRGCGAFPCRGVPQRPAGPGPVEFEDRPTDVGGVRGGGILRAGAGKPGQREQGVL